MLPKEKDRGMQELKNMKMYKGIVIYVEQAPIPSDKVRNKTGTSLLSLLGPFATT